MQWEVVMWVCSREFEFVVTSSDSYSKHLDDGRPTTCTKNMTKGVLSSLSASLKLGPNCL